MQILKYIMLFFILVGCSLLGRIISKKYAMRVVELEEMKNALNMFKAKIKFTYEPIPEIFEEIAQNTTDSISQIFRTAKEKMTMFAITASEAWEEAVEESQNALKKEDKYVLKTLSKLLGQTDIEGQVSQIEITQKFLENRIKGGSKRKRKK